MTHNEWCSECCWRGTFKRGLFITCCVDSVREPCLSVLLVSGLAAELMESRNVSGYVSPHPWLNTRITKVLVSASVASLPPELLIGQVLGGARVELCWPQARGPHISFVDRLVRQEEVTKKALWLHLYSRRNSGIDFLSCQPRTEEQTV